MSSGNREREQAGKLLHAMTDIDDVFLLEAMTEEEKTAFFQPEERIDETQLLKKKSRMRRFSRWALTAAACLAVIILGRIVSVESVKNAEQTPAVVSSAVDEADRKTAENAADEAADAPANAAAEVSADMKAKTQADMEEAAPANEAAEAPVDSAAEAPAEEMADMEEAAEAPANAAASSAGAGLALTMPNPFIDAKTLEEAEKTAGFPITLPDVEKPYDTVLYRAIKDQMIEVIWLDQNGQELYRIRKGKNMEDDISGVSYGKPVSETLETDGLKITVTGEKEGEWGTAVWTQDGEDETRWSWSVSKDSAPLTKDEILRFAQEMVEQSQPAW